MGSCLSCNYANRAKSPALGASPSTQPVKQKSEVTSKRDDANSNLKENSSVNISACSLSAAERPNRPNSGLETTSGREKKLSICSTYSDRPLQDLPRGIPEDNVLTVYDFFNILNDGGLNPYIHEDGNFLIIDCRSKDLYIKQHVVTARHFEELSTDINFQSGLGYSLYNIIIIYGNGFKQSDMSQLVSIWQEISVNVAGDVLVLSESFEIFKDKFPFMCTKNKIITTWERKNLLTYPSVIINGKLYQGKGAQATNVRIIKDLKITHVVNITREHPNAFPEKVIYLKLSIDDEKDSNLLKHFEETSEFMEKAFKMKGVVLVHCNLGISRSSSVVLAYLMKTQKINLHDAYEFLKSRRSCARPNVGFLAQLSQWEYKIFGEKITDVDDL